MRLFWLILSSLITIIAISSTVNAGLFGYDSYDECVVSEMRGQDNSMKFTVMDYCRQEFPLKEMLIDLSSVDFALAVGSVVPFSDEEYEPAKLIVIRNTSQLIPVRVTLSHYLKSCFDYQNDIFNSSNISETIEVQSNGTLPFFWGLRASANWIEADGRIIYKGNNQLFSECVVLDRVVGRELD